MSNPDRFREAQIASYLHTSRGEAGARKFIVHCANRTTDGFWSRVNLAFEELIDELERQAALEDAEVVQ